MATREEVDAWLKPQGYKLKDDAEGSWTPGRSWWDRYIENAVKVSGASIAKGVGGIVQSVGESILDDRPFYQQALEEYGVEGVPSPEDLAGGQAPHGATGTWGKSIEEKINEPEGLSEIVGSVVAGTGKSLADSANEIIERLRPREDASWLEKTGFEVLHNVGVNAPGLAASIITKKPVYGLATLGGVSYGNKYTDERKLGATPDEAHQRASAAAGSEVATELVPISVILKPGLKLTQRIGYNILSEILGENVNTAYEMMQDRAIHNPDMPLGDFITQELLPAFGNTTKVSALSSFIMGAAAHPFVREPRIQQTNKQEVPGVKAVVPETKEVKIETPGQSIPTPEKSAEASQKATISTAMSGAPKQTVPEVQGAGLADVQKVTSEAMGRRLGEEGKSVKTEPGAAPAVSTSSQRKRNLDEIVDYFYEKIDIATDNEHIGIRGDDAIIKKTFRKSWNRPDNVKTTRLPGVSVVYVGYDNISKEALKKAIEEAEKYGKNIYLVAGKSPTDLQYLANDPQERLFVTNRILASTDELEDIQAISKGKPDQTKEAPAVSKEPWQMTRDEVLESIRQPGRKTEVKPNMYSMGKGILTSGMTVGGIPASEVPGWENALTEHYDAVKQALSEGKDVPPEVLKDYPDLQPHVPGVQGEQKASKQFFLDAMVADQKITAADAQEIKKIVTEHGWTDKEVEDFVKIANNLGVTNETETNKVRNALFVSLLKQEVYKKNEEKYKWEIAANDKTISNLVKTLKIRGGSPESVKLNVDNVLSTEEKFAKIKTPEELYKVIDETFGKSITFKQLGTREIQNLAAAMLTEGKEGKKITRLEDVDKDAIETLADKAKLEKIRDATPGTVLNAVEQRAAGYIKKYMAMRAHSIGNLYKQAQNQQEKNEILDAFSQAIDSFLNIDLVERGSSSEGALSMRVQQMPLEEGVLPTEGEIRIPAAEEIEKIRSLPKDKILQILEVFDKAKTQPEYDEIAKRLTESFGRNLFETINQIWINGLLSALPTHSINLASGIYTAFSAIPERYVSEKFGGMIGGRGVAKGEAAALLYGEYMAFWDSLKAARQMWKTGKSLLTNQTKWEIHRRDRLNSANANIMLGKLGFGNMNKTLAKVVDFMGKSILNLPVRGLITADEFFKVLNYKADIYAIAHRKVTNKILEGKLDAKYAAKQIAREAKNPTYAMKDEAMNFAREQTMSRPDGTVTKILNTIIDRFPPAKVVVPFRIAPESIIKYGLERFPALNMVHHETRANLFGNNGAVARDMELGKLAFGGMVLGSVAALAMAGFITGGGPRDPELRKAWLEKNKPYSLNFGGGYSYSFKRFDFMLFGLVADLAEIAYHASDTELAKTGVAIWYSLKNNLVDRQYLDGIMNVIDAFDRGGNAAYNYVKNLSGSGIPAIVALGAKATDPVVRDVVTILDRLKSRIPGMSDDLPAVRNLYGKKTMHSPTFGSIWVSPILMGVPNDDPVYDEIIKNQIEVSYPERYVEGTNPGRFPSLSTQRTGHGVALTPQQYEQLMIYFGEGMKEDLTKAINSDAYKEGSEGVDGRQAAILRSVINRHKENARDKLIYETENLQKQIYEKKQRKYEALNR